MHHPPLYHQSTRENGALMTNPLQPFSSRGNHPVGVLLLHGFTGSPASMRPWAEHLAAANFSVDLPVLPGHATSWQELNRTTWHQWYAAAQISYLKLLKECDEVFVAGLSMGGALALRLAQHQREISGLMLVNPALQAKNKLLKLAPVLGKVIPSVPAVGNDIAKPNVTEHSYDRTPIAAAASMLDLWSDVKKGLHLVTTPVQVFTSLNDHIVPVSSSELIINNVSTPLVHREHIFLEQSYHVATLDHESDVIFDKSVQFVKSKSKVS